VLGSFRNSAALLLEYDAAFDTLALTSRNDGAYVNRWVELSRASDRLYEAQRREQLVRTVTTVPNYSMNAKNDDRRLPGVTDRRRSHRDGRHQIDADWSAPPSLVPCPDCGTGTADLRAWSTDGTSMTVTYRCRKCGHKFERIAEQ
jgi:DNA-directed RNA polymerase subunit M/transcription elongation factor TFIIS